MFKWFPWPTRRHSLRAGVTHSPAVLVNGNYLPFVWASNLMLREEPMRRQHFPPPTLVFPASGPFITSGRAVFLGGPSECKVPEERAKGLWLIPMSVLLSRLSPPLFWRHISGPAVVFAEGAAVWRWGDPEESMLKWVPQEREPWRHRGFSKLLLLSDYSILHALGLP